MAPQKQPVRKQFHRHVAAPHLLEERWFLPMFSSTDKSVIAIFVDDMDSCSKDYPVHRHPNDNAENDKTKGVPRRHHDSDEVPGNRLYHRYQTEEGKLWAIRCPKSLTPEEAGRIQRDKPPGAYRDILRQYKANAILRMKGKAPKRQEDEGAWRQ